MKWIKINLKKERKEMITERQLEKEVNERRERRRKMID